MTPSESTAKSQRRLGWRAWAVVAVVGGALIAMLWPALQTGSDYGFARRTRDNLKQVGLAAHNFTSHENRGTFPAPAAAAEIAGPGNPVPSWQTVLLPFVDARRTWEAYDLTQPYDHPANAAAVGTELDVFLDRRPTYNLPTAGNGFGLSHYAGNVRVLGAGGEGRPEAIADGISHTLLAGQVAGFYRPWADPTNLRDASAGFGASPRQFGGPPSSLREANGATDGAYLLLCDGSTLYLSAEMDPAAFAALGTPAGGEPLEEWDLNGESEAAWRRRIERRRERSEAGSALAP